MTKKGFTLAELMGVVVILGVLALITIPVIDKSLKDGREKLYQTQLQNLRLSLESWASDHPFLLPEKGGEITLTLGQLKQAEYVEIDVKNPKTKKMFPDDMLFVIQNQDGIYQYLVLENSGTAGNETQFNKNAPVLTLNGNPYEKVEAGSIYQDKGVIAKTAGGEIIPENRIVVTITGSGDTVNTSVVDNQYKIKYTVTDSGATSSIIRTVVIKDMTAPVLTIPENSTITAGEVASLDLMAGVSATDNSGEVPKITKSGTVNTVPMTYSITYQATDNSGNTTTRTRLITVTR